MSTAVPSDDSAIIVNGDMVRAHSRGLRTAASYDFGRVLGNGSFGIVCEARCIETGEQVAIKKVLQDPRYKNRELDVMKELCHPNIVQLKDFFYTTSSTSGDTRDAQRYLNVVMHYVPETVYRVMKTFTRSSQPLPMVLVRLYTYQMCRSLGYLHSLGICHRDIKPQNLLVDTRTHVLKLCDFGSAKRLVPGEPSVSYICSRFYRAPELMLGATEYDTAIDIWSIGCVLGELLLGRPLFAGDNAVDQLVKIIQVLGTPTRQQMRAMNRNYTEFRFPDVKPKDWHSVFNGMSNNGSHITDDALDLLDGLLRYEPCERLGAYESLAHPFFEPLRQPGCRLPDGLPLPNLFNFSEDELRCMSIQTRARVIPGWIMMKRPVAADSSPSYFSGAPAGGSRVPPTTTSDHHQQPTRIRSPPPAFDRDCGGYGGGVGVLQAVEGSQAPPTTAQQFWR